MNRNTLGIAWATLAFAQLAGCGGSHETNPQQDAFVSKIDTLNRELLDLNTTNVLGGDGGKLPPEHLNEQLSAKRAEADRLLATGAPTAKLWNAQIGDLDRDGDFVSIGASYGDQTYRLFLFDAAAKKAAEALSPGDHILFSGNLGPERSMTRVGGLSSPEFQLYPTEIRTEHQLITQAPAEVTALEASDKRTVQMEEADSDRADAVVRLCKKTVISNLHYPASGSFSWFKKDITKADGNRWIYTDVITAKNGLGGNLPVRFRCIGTVKGDRLSASVIFLD